MKRSIVGLCLLSSLGLCACDNSAQGPGGSGGGSATGGIVASGGVTGSGGLAGGRGTAVTGGSGAGMTSGTGGTMVGGRSGSGGRVSTGGQATGGATGSQAVCPYTAATFSCEGACKSLHAFSARCGSDPTVPSEIQAMLALYGQVEVVCTSTCAIVAPASEAQWKCFQGLPNDAPCAAIAGCDATNCP